MNLSYKSNVFVCLFLFIVLTCLTSAKKLSNVPVKLFVPKPIKITVDDLLPPYHTVSAQKPSIIEPPSQNATLLVPDLDFHVTIYRENMKFPRQMIYTPTGDILVTEMRGSRISILSDDDTLIFADQSNGISKAFGMAFIKV